MTREQIEEIAAKCGVGISYTKMGKGGFIVDSTNIKYKSTTDMLMESFGISNGKKYPVMDETIFFAA